jgi:hypothetical protein
LSPPILLGDLPDFRILVLRLFFHFGKVLGAATYSAGALVGVTGAVNRRGSRVGNRRPTSVVLANETLSAHALRNLAYPRSIHRAGIVPGNDNTVPSCVS